MPRKLTLIWKIMRYALGIEYDGSNYCGWQRQKSVVSVQETLELALSKVADEPIEVICAGRTDTGVNATNQVIHFNTDKIRKDVAWTLGVNTHLPLDVAVPGAYTGIAVSGRPGCGTGLRPHAARENGRHHLLWL